MVSPPHDAHNYFDFGGTRMSHGPVRPSPLSAWQWQSMIMAYAFHDIFITEDVLG
jgi:hypothetical protein